jgi:hypothetical protein
MLFIYLFGILIFYYGSGLILYWYISTPELNSIPIFGATTLKTVSDSLVASKLYCYAGIIILMHFVIVGLTYALFYNKLYFSFITKKVHLLGSSDWIQDTFFLGFFIACYAISNAFAGVLPSSIRNIIFVLGNYILLYFPIFFIKSRGLVTNPSYRTYRFFITIYFALVVSVGFISGWKSNFVLPIAMLIIIWLLTQRKINYKPFLLLIVLYLFTTFFVYPYVEKFREEASSNLSRAERLVKSIESFEHIDLKDEFMNNTANLSSRVTRLDDLALVAYNHEVLGKNYFNTLKYTFINLIPRFIYPNKPSVTYETRWLIPRIYGKSSLTNTDDSTSLGFTTISDAYLNGGVIIVIAYSIFIGLIMGMFNKTLFKATMNGYLRAGLVIFLVAPALSGKAVYDIVGDYFRILITLYILLNCLKLLSIKRVSQE